MTWYTYGPYPAYDQRTQQFADAGATGSMYATDDLDLETPLDIQGVDGNELASLEVAGNHAIPQFQTTQAQAIWATPDGSFRVPMYSQDAIILAVTAGPAADNARIAAEMAQGLAAQSAQDAIDAREAAEDAAATAAAVPADSIDEHLGGDATDLVDRVEILEGAAGGGSALSNTMTVQKDPVTGFWPTGYDVVTGAPSYTGGATSTGKRPTDKAYITVYWKGPDPSPAIVTSGDGGMLDKIDMRLVTP